MCRECAVVQHGVLESECNQGRPLQAGLVNQVDPLDDPDEAGPCGNCGRKENSGQTAGHCLNYLDNVIDFLLHVNSLARESMDNACVHTLHPSWECVTSEQERNITKESVKALNFLY